MKNPLLGILVIGHLPIDLGMEELYASGQSQLAHITSITQAIMYDMGGISPDNYDDFLKYMRENSSAIALKLKENNITLSSTIWLHGTIQQQGYNLPEFLKTVKLEYMNPGWVEGPFISKGWLPGNNSYESPDPTNLDNKRYSEIYWKNYVEAEHVITRALVNNGVAITAGTDANGACGVIPGFSLHDELESLHEID